MTETRNDVVRVVLKMIWIKMVSFVFRLPWFSYADCSRWLSRYWKGQIFRVESYPRRFG